MKTHNRRLLAIEAACAARPSRDLLAQQFGADLAKVYGGPVASVPVQDALAVLEEVYRDEDA